MTDLPNPYPPRNHPPLLDLSFAALGWLHRSAIAVGSDRFEETVQRTRFYLSRAVRHALTPAETAVITGLATCVDGLIQADTAARHVLADSVTGIADACAAEVVQLLDATEGA